MDAVLTFMLLAELHQEFNCPLHVVYINIKATFDLFDRSLLWLTLKGVGIPDLLLNLVGDLHTGTPGARVCVGSWYIILSCFYATAGGQQGCILALPLFSEAISWLSTCRYACRNQGWSRSVY